MDWIKTEATPAKFAYIRAAYWHTVDEQLDNNVANCNLPRGFYYAPSPSGDAMHEATLFCDLIEDLRWELPPAIDCELEGIEGHLEELVKLVEERLGVTPVIYTRGGWWNKYVGDVVWAAASPLWIARYNDTIDGPWADGKYKPVSWDHWTFWQFSAGGNGRGAEFGARSADIDLNWFNGTLEEMLAMVPAPEEVELPYDLLKAEVDALQTRIVALENRAGVLENGAAALEARVGALESGVGLLVGRADGLDDRAGILDGRTGALEDRIEALASNLGIAAAQLRGD
jgi:GH25 family lysozyme M1 (1,4-beta-N-acetylmuramidase)